MRAASVFALGLVSLVASACAPVDEGAAPALSSGQAPHAGFHCPPPGTSVTYATGAVLTFTQPRGSDHAVCAVDATPGGPQERLFAIFPLPFDGAAEVRSGLAPLFPLAVGKQAKLTRTGLTARRQRFDYVETARVLRQETVAVANQERTAWVLEILQEAQHGNTALIRFTYWIDAESGVVLRSRADRLRGTVQFRPATAVGLTVATTQR